MRYLIPRPLSRSFSQSKFQHMAHKMEKHIGPASTLPLPKGHSSPSAFVDSILHFSTSCELLQTLCGGVHILDFFTRPADVYETVFPRDWREWFKSTEIMDVLDLLMREDLRQFSTMGSNGQWRCGPAPPSELVQYVREVRRHCLDREFRPRYSEPPELVRHVAVGMKAKKVHEVANFAKYISHLTAELDGQRNQSVSHLVDFGSGQNYLGRALSTEPYNKKIIAIESRTHNVEGARDKDVLAKIVEKPVIMRNKKVYRSGPILSRSEERRERIEVNSAKVLSISKESHWADGVDDAADNRSISVNGENGYGCTDEKDSQAQERGNIIYVDQRVENGDLMPVLSKAFPSTARSSDTEIAHNLVTLSLHSCGNLLHHGLRTIKDPRVSAVALIGCCYNLMTERLGPPSYKLPGLELRSSNARLDETSSARDPHGFPMSQRLAEHQSPGMSGPGVRLNITARMMAVQAPANWTSEESDAFFIRHFYRAVLQRIFVDFGIVHASEFHKRGDTWTQPIIIGSLRKTCYKSFLLYVRGAVEKITGPNSPSPHFSAVVAEKLSPESVTDQVIQGYEERFAPRKHDLAITWSLMAFSAEVVESIVVVDRWLWLMEQDEVDKAWVEAVFDYKQSPRNFVVVGVKK